MGLSRIVLIEDDPDIAAFMSEMLVDLGHDAELFSTLDGARGGPADLVITDLVQLRAFDVSSAREWVSRVRAAFPGARVVVSTAHAPAASIGAAAMGADAVLTKPFEVETFSTVVEGLLPH
jgi:DNA-binding response OmpR family regulator